jgi:hypothetical protein
MNSRARRFSLCAAPLCLAAMFACWPASATWCFGSGAVTASAPTTRRTPAPPSSAGFQQPLKAVRLTGWATWYSRDSCLAESGQATMANGQPLDDSRPTCALWLVNSRGRPRRPDGRTVSIRLCGGTTASGSTAPVAGGTPAKSASPSNGMGSVRPCWTDNGPGKKPRSRGVVVDLSRAAMLQLAGPEGLRAGRVRVTVEMEER